LTSLEVAPEQRADPVDQRRGVGGQDRALLEFGAADGNPPNDGPDAEAQDGRVGIVDRRIVGVPGPMLLRVK